MGSARTREARHVRLYHWMMRLPAWATLDCTARAAYIELVSRYSGTDDKGFSNNGRIPLSLLELANALHISKQTAMRALASLEERGFIVIEAKGRFTTGFRSATEWRLTEFPSNGKAPTKDFTRWKNPLAGSQTKPDRVSQRNRSGFDMEQVSNGDRSYGSSKVPDHQEIGSNGKPLLVYQGEGVASVVATRPHSHPAPVVSSLGLSHQFGPLTIGRPSILLSRA